MSQRSGFLILEGGKNEPAIGRKLLTDGGRHHSDRFRDETTAREKQPADKDAIGLGRLLPSEQKSF
jgi:hypothetical protein